MIGRVADHIILWPVQSSQIFIGLARTEKPAFASKSWIACMATGVTTAANVAGVSVIMRTNISRALHRSVLHCDVEDSEIVTAAEICEIPSSCCAEAAGITCTPEKHCTVADTLGGSAPGRHMKYKRSRRSARHITTYWVPILACMMQNTSAWDLETSLQEGKSIINWIFQ